MINQIYLSVLFRAKSVKENIYKSLLTLSTCAHTTAHTQHTHTHAGTLEMTIKYKQNSCQEAKGTTTTTTKEPKSKEEAAPRRRCEAGAS